MRGRPFAIVTLSCFIIFIITATTYWWRTIDDDGNHQSLSSLLAPLSHGPTTPYSASGDLFPIGKKVAVIVETRPLRTLIPLILHFASVLGPEWPILFFTRASTISTLSAFGHGSQPFKRLVNSGQVKIIELPTEPYLGNYLGLSHFLAGRRVEDFFGYDFVGAWHPWVPEAFNGGLSLRNVSLARKVVSTYNIADDVGGGTKDGEYEDVWFCRKMMTLGGRFPDEKRASEFAVDLVWGERPMGYHGVNKGAQKDILGKERMEQMYEWCPEAKLAASHKEILELNEDEKNSGAIVEDVQTTGGGSLTFG
ncbi:hypothetical protein F5882DRAFT_359073 [Hyaloscypha sp. PMI_1271]|nr:hypothetical protein F5882DRAFT_359073 [Hyaloscypha sp. PMI_1271]